MTPEPIRTVSSEAQPWEDESALPQGNLAGGLRSTGLRRRSLAFAKPDLTSEELDAVQRVLVSGWLTSGPETLAFENEFAAAVGARFGVAVNSATAGLHLGLALHDLTERDAILVPAITFTATAEVVGYSGAMPLIVDVDRDDYLLTPAIVQSFLNEQCWQNPRGEWIHRKSGRRVRGMIPVHFGGRPCDMDGLMALARSENLLVVEDAAHAFPSHYKGKAIGSVGPLSVFSFYATKNLTTGEGGMITTDNEQWAARLREMRLHGIRGQTYGRKRWHYDVVERGYKYNMMDMCAALGRVQLKRSPGMLAKRSAIHDYYDNALANLAGITLNPACQDGSSHHLYTIEIGPEAPFSRDRFVDEMLARGIATSLHFIPLYRHTYYREEFGLDPTMFPQSEAIFSRIVSLPIYSGMSLEDAQDVSAAIHSLYQTN